MVKEDLVLRRDTLRLFIRPHMTPLLMLLIAVT